MMNILLAHAGETHQSVTEATKHATESSSGLSAGLSYWLALIIIPLLLLLGMRFFKVKFPMQLLIISTFLIIFSIFSYQQPGIYSAIALAVGFGIVFAQTIVGLSDA